MYSNLKKIFLTIWKRVVLQKKSQAEKNIKPPTTFTIKQNHPNPFNPTTMIRFDVPESLYNNVVLNVFDIKGRLVETILDKELTPGSHAIRWDAKSKPSGVYFLRMNAEKYSKSYKMILMK